jgi:ABC-type cobalt transport system substrate-binding protein
MVTKIVIGVFIILVAGGIYFSPSYAIAVSPATLNLKQYQTGTVTVKLMYKPWFKSFKPISGTINAKIANTGATVSPLTATTNSAGGRVTTFTVTGITPGTTSKLFFSGTSRNGTHEDNQVTVIVAPKG